jgi:putative iron-regulated protein
MQFRIKKGIMLVLLLFCSALVSCKNDLDDGGSNVDVNQILSDRGNLVILSTYQDLLDRAQLLEDSINSLVSVTTVDNLEKAQEDWILARKPWERSEGFLFGPVDTEGIDPNLDTWPVDENSIQAVLDSNEELTQEFISTLDGTLKGFHVMEYFLFTNGVETSPPEEVTAYLIANPRALEYLVALIEDFVLESENLFNAWDSSGGNYLSELAEAGQGNSVYRTRNAALKELVNGIIGISEEVADEKIKVPFESQDIFLVESRFSQRSLETFTDNIIGVQEVYLGKSGGMGLTAFIAAKDPSADKEVREAIERAIEALESIATPFEETMFDPACSDVINEAIDAVEDLHETLEDEVLSLL